MKVKDFIEELKQLPQDSDILFATDSDEYQKIDIQWDEQELDCPYIYLSDKYPLKK